MPSRRARAKVKAEAKPVGPGPDLQRSTSASSPLVRHDGILRSEEPTADIQIPQASWDIDFKACLAANRSSKVDSKRLLATYALVAGFLDDDIDAVFGEGMLRFFEALDVDPAGDLVALEVARSCNAKDMGIFRRLEFIHGLMSVGVDTLDGLKSRVPEMRLKLEDIGYRQGLYVFTFDLAIEPPARTLDVEDACSLWSLFMPQWPHLEAWFAWLEAQKARPITRDIWLMFWKLAVEEPPDLQSYDDNVDWPSAFDNFVAHLREMKAVAP